MKKYHLGVVIPFRAKSSTTNWEQATKLLFQTLQSLLHQSDPDWYCVVVCHDMPDFYSEITDDRIQFHEVPFLEPKQEKEVGYFLSNRSQVEDKTRKILAGLQTADKAVDVDYWLQLDADDLLHCDFVKTLRAKRPKVASIVRNGYVFYSDVDRIEKVDYMDSICGSTAVIASEVFEIDHASELEGKNSAIPYIQFYHSEFFTALSQWGEVDIFEDPMLIYVLNTGINHSDIHRRGLCAFIKTKLKVWLRAKRIDEQIKNDFHFISDSADLDGGSN